MAALLALASAAAFSVGDVLGGLASRRAHELVVALLSQVAGLAVLAVVLPLGGIAPTRSALAWGLLAGIGGAGGLVAYFRALAIGPMGITAPVAALVAAGIPVVAGLVAGERPGATVLVGVVLAVAATVLVSRPSGPSAEPVAGPHGTVAEHMAHEVAQDDLDRVVGEPTAGMAGGDTAAAVRGEPTAATSPASTHPASDDATAAALGQGVATADPPTRLRRGLAAAVVAGLLFSLFMIALDRAPDDGGLWPLLGARAAGLALLGGLVLGRRPPRPDAGSTRIGLVSGLLDMVANVLFLLATQQGLLVVVSVLASLYPVGIALLARVFLDEKLARLQWVGVALAVTATVLVGS